MVGSKHFPPWTSIFANERAGWKVFALGRKYCVYLANRIKCDYFKWASNFCMPTRALKNLIETENILFMIIIIGDHRCKVQMLFRMHTKWMICESQSYSLNKMLQLFVKFVIVLESLFRHLCHYELSLTIFKENLSAQIHLNQKPESLYRTNLKEYTNWQ